MNLHSYNGYSEKVTFFAALKSKRTTKYSIYASFDEH